MDDVKLCVNCKYFIKSRHGDHLSNCSHPDDKKRSVINGHGGMFCENARSWGHCGKEGKNWEPKEMVLPDSALNVPIKMKPKSFWNRLFS